MGKQAESGKKYSFRCFTNDFSFLLQMESWKLFGCRYHETNLKCFSKNNKTHKTSAITKKKKYNQNNIFNTFATHILNLNIMSYTYEYPRPAVTADCVVITKEDSPKVLLIQRGGEPYKGCWAFPGGFMDMDETTEQCAIRELKEETGLHIKEVKQIGAYSKVSRDPRGRTISVAYLAVIDKPAQVRGLDDAAKAEWFDLSALPELAFDHADIMSDAIRLYNKTK